MHADRNGSGSHDMADGDWDDMLSSCSGPAADIVSGDLPINTLPAGAGRRTLRHEGYRAFPAHCNRKAGPCPW